MKIPGCKRCLKLRTALLAMICGAGAGALAIGWGAGSQVSMTATFFGAIVPVLWYSRKTRK